MQYYTQKCSHFLFCKICPRMLNRPFWLTSFFYLIIQISISLVNYLLGEEWFEVVDWFCIIWTYLWTRVSWSWRKLYFLWDDVLTCNSVLFIVACNTFINICSIITFTIAGYSVSFELSSHYTDFASTMWIMSLFSIIQGNTHYYYYHCQKCLFWVF